MWSDSLPTLQKEWLEVCRKSLCSFTEVVFGHTLNMNILRETKYLYVFGTGSTYSGCKREFQFYWLLL